MAEPTGILSIAAAAVAAGGAILQGVWKAKDDREKEERARRESEDKEDREAISRRLGALESKVVAHDIADARHDQALEHLSALLTEIRDELREMRRALLERPGSSPGGRR
jgi:predicted RNase H-like nuclease (RuvC/YqgF family)